MKWSKMSFTLLEPFSSSFKYFDDKGMRITVESEVDDERPCLISIGLN